MKAYKHILAIDPSGSFTEGKGTTGWVLMNSEENLLGVGAISAKDYKCSAEYWDAHITLLEEIIKLYDDLIIVIEEYVLYRERCISQTNSKMETCRLIGVIQHYCWQIGQPYSMQLASSVKTRWSDDLLIREHILKHQGRGFVHIKSGIAINVVHIRDAFRHAVHYAVCRNDLDRQSAGVKYDNSKRSNY